MNFIYPSLCIFENVVSLALIFICHFLYFVIDPNFLSHLKLEVYSWFKQLQKLYSICNVFHAYFDHYMLYFNESAIICRHLCNVQSLLFRISSFSREKKNIWKYFYWIVPVRECKLGRGVAPMLSIFIHIVLAEFENYMFAGRDLK